MLVFLVIMYKLLFLDSHAFFLYLDELDLCIRDGG